MHFYYDCVQCVTYDSLYSKLLPDLFTAACVVGTGAFVCVVCGHHCNNNIRTHPDYIIATVNLSNEQDYYYLSTLNADAAPALIPYMAKQGYDLDCFDWEKMVFKGKVDGEYVERFSQDGFGYYYLERLMERCRPMSVRTYNISRDMALQTVQKYRQ